jgi:hypothetical protein
MRRSAVKAGALAFLALALAAPSASATFHEMSIREVYPGSALEPSSEYVELQMWRSGQNFVGGHVLRTYDASGGEAERFLAADVSNGANQSTILIATAAAASHFGVAADDELPLADRLDPAGGAVCWEAIDCVSWGSFKGKLPSPAGTPAATIPDQMALRRTIAPGCPTLLEPTDDHNNSLADLSAVFPAPRPNSVAPAERACASSGGPQGQGGQGGSEGGRGAPQTTLRGKPRHKTRDRSPTFRFSADEPRSTFQCKLDGKPYRQCQSPFTSKRLSLGAHTFKVRARDDSGRLDPSAARYTFSVVAKP